MSRRQPIKQIKPANKPEKVNAWTGVQLGIRPFLIDDIFRQPTKEWLDTTTIEYIPFQTFDLWQLDRIQAITTNSPTTSAIIQQKVNYSVGDGFFVVPSATMSMLTSLRQQKIDKSQITLEQEQQLNEFLTVVNAEGENIEEFTSKVINDFCSFGNAFIEISKIKVGKTLKYYMRLLPIMWCRPKKAAEHEMYPTHIGISSEFEQHYWTTPKAPYELPLFPHFEKIDGVEKSVVHLKNYEPTLTYWGVPDWISAKIWAELEYRIPKFNQSKFENGFTPSAIVSLFGSTNQEEAETLVRAMKDCFTGTGNNSKMFIQALRDETYKADVQILESKNDGEFTKLQEMSQTAIISAHRWTHSLTGLRTAGSLGTNQQIRSEFDIVYNTVIRPIQRLFLTKFLNPVIQDAAAFFGYDWSNMAVDIAKSMPVSFAGDLDIKTVLTMDEQRAELGFPPLEVQPVVMAKVRSEETYNDYPEAAVNNAKRAIKWAEENGWGSCGEATGKARANQLANKEKISRDTIARMASFKRHQQHKNVPYNEGCGGLMWDAWGGDEGIEWAIRKLKQIDNANTN
jgi:capsid portal protein